MHDLGTGTDQNDEDCEKRIRLSVRELIELRSWLSKIQDVLAGHESDLKETFLRLDQIAGRMENMNLILQDVRRDAQELKQISFEQRQSVRNLWYGVLLAIATAVVTRIIAVVK